MADEPSFVFEGTVVEVGAATLASIEVNDLTAIVRVDRVLRAPEAMEKIAGRDITVRLRRKAEAGATAVFSADGWIYGESLAVIETGTRGKVAAPPPAAAADAEPRVESAAAADRAERFRTALKARADEASAVVVGRVTGVMATAAPTEGRLSEHDPHLAVATVEVDQALKGSPSKTIQVTFASSEDVMWRDAPKLALGQKAVMLLQTGAPEVQDKRAHAVLNKLDVQPAHTADLVAELV